jgi:hypothetical protein
MIWFLVQIIYSKNKKKILKNNKKKKKYLKYKFFLNKKFRIRNRAKRLL